MKKDQQPFAILSVSSASTVSEPGFFVETAEMVFRVDRRNAGFDESSAFSGVLCFVEDIPINTLKTRFFNLKTIEEHVRD